MVAISMDSRSERWRHDRPRVARLVVRRRSLFTGCWRPCRVRRWPWPMGSCISRGRQRQTGCTRYGRRQSAQRASTWDRSGRDPRSPADAVYVALAIRLFGPNPAEAFFPKSSTGVLYSFGLLGDDEVGRSGPDRNRLGSRIASMGAERPPLAVDSSCRGCQGMIARPLRFASADA